MSALTLTRIDITEQDAKRIAETFGLAIDVCQVAA
jgi:hypothetical protein